MPFAHGPYDFTPSVLDTTTQEAGVYGIANDKFQMIYVGQTDNLQRRLREHYNDNKDCVWGYAPKKFYVEIVSGGEAARKKREEELIKEYNFPPCNKQV